jgi:quercetin dioxygenase-like cupin family protein
MAKFTDGTFTTTELCGKEKG